ncbi:hypothetical protein SAMN02910292_01350 [Lachnospiraceae bacterium XBB2008]|nr:hypothetical protein SAMN02910292_01350 [Lachnospiraceae bacterium XBB2008]
MKNMMREYLGKEYTDNKIKNFCRYWLKASEGSGDTWRAENDLDCMYFGGDLRADTLMSAWTPIKWVAEYVNEENGMKFCKVARNHDDPGHYLKLLLENPDVYLPRKHPLVQLLYRFLELAELRCNFICLPDRDMNPARYRTTIKGRDTWLYDEVPVTLSHIFDPDSLGRFFLNRYGQVDRGKVIGWIISEHLEMGFKDGVIDRDHVIPYSELQPADKPRWFNEGQKLKDMLQYNINFLMARLTVLKAEEEERKICTTSHEDKIDYAAEIPDGVTSDKIRELYEVLISLPQPYVYINKYYGRYFQPKLYHLNALSAGFEETQYGVDSMGIELPWNRDEWLDLSLEAADGSEENTVCRIKLDALRLNNQTPEEILKEYKIIIPE